MKFVVPERGQEPSEELIEFCSFMGWHGDDEGIAINDTTVANPGDTIKVEDFPKEQRSRITIERKSQ